MTWIDFISLLASGGASDELRYALVDSMISPESGAFLLRLFDCRA